MDASCLIAIIPLIIPNIMQMYFESCISIATIILNRTCSVIVNCSLFIITFSIQLFHLVHRHGETNNETLWYVCYYGEVRHVFANRSVPHIHKYHHFELYIHIHVFAEIFRQHPTHSETNSILVIYSTYTKYHQKPILDVIPITRQDKITKKMSDPQAVAQDSCQPERPETR